MTPLRRYLTKRTGTREKAPEDLGRQTWAQMEWVIQKKNALGISWSFLCMHGSSHPFIIREYKMKLEAGNKRNQKKKNQKPTKQENQKYQILCQYLHVESQKVHLWQTAPSPVTTLRTNLIGLTSLSNDDIREQFVSVAAWLGWRCNKAASFLLSSKISFSNPTSFSLK